MECLPQEILAEIFIFLPPKDLCVATLVCKHFNDVIESTPNVLNKFRLNLNSRKMENHAWIGSRRYSRALLKDPSKNSLKILKNVAENLTELRIILGRVHLSSLRKILVAATKLKDFSLVKVNLIDQEGVDGPLPSLKLNSLSTNGDKRLFKILTNSSVRKMSLYSVNLTEDEKNCLKNFLKSQKNLEILKFSTFDEEIKLFDDEMLTNVDFRLKKMALHNVKTTNLGFFLAFAKLHEMTLESLTIQQDFHTPQINSTLGEILSHFRCLRELSLGKISLPGNFLPTIERLRLQKMTKFNFEAVCVLFPNVKSLEIVDMTKLKINGQDLKFLEKFSLENCDLENLELPKVKKLAICETKVDEKVLKVGKFEELSVENCEIYFNVWRPFLSDENLELKVLRVENCFVGEKVRKLMEKSNVKNLVLINCEEKVDNDERIKRMKLE